MAAGRDALGDHQVRLIDNDRVVFETNPLGQFVTLIGQGRFFYCRDRSEER